MSIRRVIRTITTMLVSTGLLVIPAAVTSGSQSSDSDRHQITAILGQWEDAWNAHDMTAFASLFHEDGVWVLWTGDVWKGRGVIEDGHIPQCIRPSSGTALNASISKN